MIEGLLMAAAKKRAAAAAGITRAEGPITSAASGSDAIVTFAATPGNGQTIVLVAITASATVSSITFPAGFTVGASVNNGGNRTLQLAWKTAASESGAAYTITGSSTTRGFGYVLNGAHATAPIGNGTASVGTTGTSSDMLATAVDISAGSFVIAAFGGQSNATGAAFDNGFSTASVNGTGTITLATAYRAYASSATAQNTNATWTNSISNLRLLFLEILKA